MNDPNKAINVNLSSLLSLKAELLRKQAEVSKAKASRTNVEEYEANSSSTNSNIGDNATKKRDKKHRNKDVSKTDDAIIYTQEDSALLDKSRRVLEAKAKFYNRMSRTGGKLNSDDNCLVLFNRKHQEEHENTDDEKEEGKAESSDSELSSSDGEGETTYDNPDEDWVEYIDCLGRTRKCLRQDLDEMKRKDTELAESMPERLDQTKANWMIDTKGTHADADDDDVPIGPMPTESIYSDGCSLMSKHDEQRANWERKEQENLDKPDVHYQDVFFDEARQHGVGYYAFSTDEEERKRQQRALNEARQRTITEQTQRDALRAQREKIIAERVRAAKNRQRARLGLPPLEETEEQSPAGADKSAETKADRKARKRAEKQQRKAEQAEHERELERQQHVRPWDKEKTNSNAFEKATEDIEPEWSYKPERLPMSQAEWNEKQRAERNPEFAPTPEPAKSSLKRTSFHSVPPPTASYNMMPPPPVPAPGTDTFAPFQSTKRARTFQRRNYEPEENDNTASSMRGAAIPPPIDLDVNHSLPKQAKRSKSNGELERSIEAGLRFLRDNSDKGTFSTKSSWTAKADY